MISTKVNDLLNEQINNEFYSGYLYLSMSNYLKDMGLLGFSKLLRHLAKNEVEYGLKLFDYLIDSSSFVTLKQIKSPNSNFEGVVSLFNKVYFLEKHFIDSLFSIVKLADLDSDKTSETFIKMIINEKIKNENLIKLIISRLETINDDKILLYSFDSELIYYNVNKCSNI